MNNRQLRVLKLKPNDEFLFSYIAPRKWEETRYKVLENKVVEMISEHLHWESTPSPAGPTLVDAERKDKFTNLNEIAKRAGKSYMVFKEI